jgi:biopolymer transport protein ExbD
MKRRRNADPGPEPTLPVTPMLDMAFQLLAFFIIIYRPSDLEGQMQLALPSKATPAAHKPQDVDPNAAHDNDPLEIPADLTVVVKTQNDGVNNGTISTLTVEARSGPATIRPAGPEQTLTEALTRYLHKIKETLEHQTSIKLQADSRLKWDSVVQVMDACRKAGFEDISFVPPPDYQQSSQ